MHPVARLLAVVAPGILASAACDAGGPLPVVTQIVGTWGGDEAGLLATDSAAHVHIGCTEGNVSGPITLSADTRQFDLPGSYNLFAYPVFNEADLRPARFSGTVSGSTMMLTVTMVDTAVTLGPVRLVRGREPTMRNCPICRRPGNQTSPIAR